MQGGAEVVADLPDEPLPVHADPVALDQVLTNLLDNAVKYSPHEKYVIVRASAERGPVRKARVLISVSDRGMGMSPEDARRVFRRFYRSPAVAGGSISGSGLGLALCAEVMRAHNGRIRVESELGKGSTFSVELPGMKE
jgi:signal transduction histidine kinase